MKWDVETEIETFRKVAELAGFEISSHDICIDLRPAPHKPPSKLPSGKMAVYVFHYGEICLKVGKAGPRTQARYTYQHYSPTAANSTLAKSILKDKKSFENVELNEDNIEDNIKEWMKKHTDRVNLLVEERHGDLLLALLEVFFQCRLNPKYEGRRKK